MLPLKADGCHPHLHTPLTPPVQEELQLSSCTLDDAYQAKQFYKELGACLGTQISASLNYSTARIDTKLYAACLSDPLLNGDPCNAYLDYQLSNAQASSVLSLYSNAGFGGAAALPQCVLDIKAKFLASNHR